MYGCRSTPRVDSFWGGKSDLTAAIGFEKDGMTTIAFRKKMKSNFYAIFFPCRNFNHLLTEEKLVYNATIGIDKKKFYAVTKNIPLMTYCRHRTDGSQYRR